jgi:exodeoxyribonuclease VIII
MGNYKTDNAGKQDLPAFAGVQDAIDSAQYHRSMGLTKSGLLMLRKSPAHFWNWLNSEPDKSTPAMNLGTATHTLLFEPHKWSKEILVVPEDAPKKPTKAQLDAKDPKPDTLAQIKWWEEFNKLSEDKCMITGEQKIQAKGMVNAVLQVKEIVELMKHPSAKAEVSITSKEVIDGMPIDCKMRCDMLTEDGRTILDLKTCEDASYDEFSRSFMSNGYWMQAAHYIATARKAGIPVERFVFIAAEKHAPYIVSMYVLDDKSLERAFAIRERLLTTLAKCMASGEFPANNGISPLTMPFYIN